MHSSVRPLRIAILAPGFGYEAGAVPMRARLEAEALRTRGHETMGFGMRLRGFTRAKLPCHCVEIKVVIPPRPLASIGQWLTYELGLARAVLREHRRKPFDLVVEHTQCFGLPLRLAGHRIKARWVLLVQRTIYDAVNSGRNPLNPVLTKMCLWGSQYEYTRADAIVTLHEGMSAEIRKHCPRAKPCFVIANGVNVSSEECHSQNRSRTQSTILYAGRLDPEKAVSVLVHAFAQVTPCGWTLRIVGDGTQRRRLEHLVRSLKIAEQVNFLGTLPHEDVLDEMKRAAIFVLPSVSEGLPFVVLEAMACGAPVIATDLPGCRAVIRNGEGLLVPPDKVGELRAALIRMMRDKPLRDELARRAAERVKAFSWETVLRRSSEFYESLALQTEKHPHSR